jgi:hypothetical protein
LPSQSAKTSRYARACTKIFGSASLRPMRSPNETPCQVLWSFGLISMRCILGTQDDITWKFTNSREYMAASA